MKQTKLIMGMPIKVDVVDNNSNSLLDKVFSYFRQVDRQFSPYIKMSEVSRVNRGELLQKDYSSDLQTVLALSEQTKKETNGYFDVWHDGALDPSGLVKGWAIQNAATILSNAGVKNYFIDAGGDIQASGKNNENKLWRVGIRNPFKQDEIVKVLSITNKGVATSGTYIRGEHIYNPKTGKPANEIVSLSVIHDTIYNADRIATACFAMGRTGIAFIETLPGYEAYMINRDGIATYTSGFDILTHFL